MRIIGRLALCLVALAVPGLAAAQRVTVGIFPGGTVSPNGSTAPAAVFEVEPSCGPPLFRESSRTVQTDPFIVLSWTDEGDPCIGSLVGLQWLVPAGVYKAAILLITGRYDERLSLAFTVDPPKPKTCMDPSTQTVFAFGEGPPVERMDNTTVAKRGAWLERERVLTRAGFDVKALLVSTSVYFAVTCR